MLEVNRHNLDSVYPRFEQELKHCSYVSFDCEFSHLPSDDSINSLFDNGEERYGKFKNHLKQSLVLQVGITIFTFVRDLKTYNASLYKFYIIPRPFAPINASLLFTSSSINFFCENKFDFNKCFYNGLSYLSQTEEVQIRKLLARGSLNMENVLDIRQRESITSHSSSIVSWSMKSSPGETYDILVKSDDFRYLYFLHQEIRRRFPDTWTYNSENNCKVIVKRVSKAERKEHESDKSDPASPEVLIESLLGFSKVFRLLTKIKKPLVGHNLFLDLLIMYNQFHRELPNNYSTFKSDIHEMFPLIFDTKLIAFETRKILNNNADTALGNIYDALQDKDGKLYSPLIKFTPGSINEDDEERLHDAGWDSYFTGFCFIKLGYFLVESRNKNISIFSVITFKECLSSLSPWENKINLARARIPYMSFIGRDPISIRPPVLHVSWKNGKTINNLEVNELFDTYGLFHSREHYNSYLLAAANFTTYNAILKDFKQHERVRVEDFSFLYHHRCFKFACCAGVLIPVGLSLWYAHKYWKR